MAEEKQSPHPLASPQPAEGLIGYQEGSIVSRSLVAASGGNVTLFAFDEAEELSEHTTPHDALVHVLDGRALVTVGDVGHEVESGELLLLPGGVPHALEALSPFKMLLVMLKQA
jgi:quercetin dioxygenase-like cupin family protein